MGSSTIRTLLSKRTSKTPSNRPTKKNTYAEALGKRRPSLKRKKDQNLPTGEYDSFLKMLLHVLGEELSRRSNAPEHQ